MRLPNGFGSIVFLGKKRRRPWAARLTVGWGNDKKQKFKYLSYHEKRKDALAALIDYNKKPYDVDRASVTFAEVFEAWASRKFDELGSHSVRNYKSIYRKCADLYELPFRELKTAHLQAVVDANKQLAHVTLLKVLFGQLYGYALKNDICEKDYSQFVEIPTKEKKLEKVPFTSAEVATLWKHKDEPFVDLVLILLYTGMRISELIEMKIENINLDERYMIGGVKTAAGRNRIIPIHAEIMPLVKAQYSPNKKYLFQSVRGNKLQYNYFAAKKFTPLMEKLKMSHTLHETRHTFISQADRVGLNGTILKKIVGHANGDITVHYTHKDITEILEEIKKFHY